MVLDRQLLEETEIGIHPNRNDATLLLAPGDLVRVIRDQGNPLGPGGPVEGGAVPPRGREGTVCAM